MRITSYLNIILLTILSGCYLAEDVPADQKIFSYTQPNEFGIDNNYLLRIDDEISSGIYENIESLIIIKNGKIIFENYYNNSNRHQLQSLSNLTLLFANVAVGLLLADNLIDSIKTPIVSLLPEYSSLFESSPLKGNITLRDLLTHKTGLAWNESIISPASQQNDLNRMRLVNDWTKFILEKPLEATPGTRYNYSSGSGLIISKIVKNLSGKSLEDYIQENVFKPLEIKDWIWTNDPQGTTDASIGLAMTQLDLAKIGYLFLNDGLWNGKEILTYQWVTQSTKLQTAINVFFQFGYIWWIFSDEFINNNSITNDTYYFPGANGEHLYIVPHKNIVICIGAENFFFGYNNPSLNLYFDIINGMP